MHCPTAQAEFSHIAIARFEPRSSWFTVIHFTDWSAPIIRLFRKLKLCSISSLFWMFWKNKYPAYLENYLQPYGSIYNTRCSEPARHMLGIPHYNYRQHKCFTHLSNSFFYSAPRLWNSLLETCRCASSLGSFRTHLKTYLWTKSFPP